MRPLKVIFFADLFSVSCELLSSLVQAAIARQEAVYYEFGVSFATT
jgi:hypothetical protein